MKLVRARISRSITNMISQSMLVAVVSVRPYD
jgi:hypothetical protein